MLTDQFEFHAETFRTWPHASTHIKGKGALLLLTYPLQQRPRASCFWEHKAVLSASPAPTPTEFSEFSFHNLFFSRFLGFHDFEFALILFVLFEFFALTIFDQPRLHLEGSPESNNHIGYQISFSQALSD